MWLSISENVVSNLRLAGVHSGHSGFLHHLKLTFPTPLSCPSIASLLYRQILSTHIKPSRRHSTAALEAGVKTVVHAKIHTLGGVRRSE